ncbi:MAG: SpoIIE family protein phosphatase [Phycisphaerae bacterium]
MERTAREYVRNVLLGHLGLLLLVVAIVITFSRTIYDALRLQAQQNAVNLQELVSQQTASGVTNHFDAILDTLSLFRQTEAEMAAGEEDEALRYPRVALTLARQTLWRQLQPRVEYLFEFDRQTGTIVNEWGGHRDADQTFDTLSPGGIAWLRRLDGPQVSPAIAFQGEPVNLVASPLVADGRRVLVAVVPTANIEQLFLNDVNRREGVSAMLLDGTSRVIASPDNETLGLQLLRAETAAPVRQLVEETGLSRRADTLVRENGVLIAGMQKDASIVTAQPMRVGDGGWHLVLVGSLERVEEVISGAFRQMLYLAAFVIVAVTTILVSTSMALIRGRTRLERVRADLIDRELKQARNIQLQWLPPPTAQFAGVSIAAVNEPASHISGDFYNWFELDDGRLVVVIGDVTGHGMAAAFLMATTQLLVRNTMARVKDPGACLEEVNRQLCVQMFNGQFVTMLALVIDQEHGELKLATAGHPPPLMCEDGHFYPLPVEPQLVMGVEADLDIPTQTVPLAGISALVLYTDGVIDTQAEDGSRFSVDQLAEALADGCETPDDIVDRAFAVLGRFRGMQEVDDDLTMVAVNLTRQPADEPEPVLKAN